MTVIEDAAAARLTSATLAWLTTVRSDGQPQTSYVWFHFNGDDILVLSRPRTAKVRNLGSNPRVSLHLDGDGSAGNDVLTIDATAEIVPRLTPARRTAYLAKYEDRIRESLQTTPDGFRESLQTTPDGFLADFSVVIRILPARVRAW